MSKKTESPGPPVPVIIGPYNAGMLFEGMSSIIKRAEFSFQAIHELGSKLTLEEVLEMAKIVRNGIHCEMDALLQESNALAKKSMEEDFLKGYQGSRPGFVH